MKKHVRLIRTTVDLSKSPELKKYVQMLSTIEGVNVSISKKKQATVFVERAKTARQGLVSRSKRKKQRIRIGIMKNGTAIERMVKTADKEYRLFSAIISTDSD